MEKDAKPLSLREMAQASKKRISIISKEFSDGFEFLLNYTRPVTFFGSTQTKPGEFYYEKAVVLSALIVKKLHCPIITGGGPGIMEAANKGAFEAGGNSLGLTIELPKGQRTNDYLTDSINFHYFFSRKVCMAFSAKAFVFFPGGFGTLNEIMEILNLVQTAKITRIPVILVGKDYWSPLLDFFHKTLLEKGMIEKEDLSLYILTDDDEEVLKIIKDAPDQETPYDHEHDIKENSDKGIADRTISRFLKWK